MTKYRAIVSIFFDDEDLAELAEHIGVDVSRMDPHETLSGELDNLGIGRAWIEQVFENGMKTIRRGGGGMMVEINAHDKDD